MEQQNKRHEEEMRSITDAVGYFRILWKHKEQYLICIAVKDTFYQVPVETARVLSDFGMENLHVEGWYPNGWQGYLFVMNQGKVILNKLANFNGCLFEKFEVSGIKVQLISRPYHRGNAAAIILNGSNLSINNRGLNVVVLDVESKTVVDSVGFDFHPQRARSWARFAEVIGTVLPPQENGGGEDGYR